MFFNMIYSIFIIFILFLVSFKNGETQEMKCDKPCIPLSTCPRAQELLRENGIRPQICNFIKFEPQVCCPSSEIRALLNDTLRISEKRCNGFYPDAVYHDDIPLGILAGYETVRDEFPYIAAIGYGDIKSPTYNCGGFLVEKNFVITAGHCAKYNGVPPSVVRIGGNPLADNTTKLIPVVKAIQHPDFQSDTELNDISILILSHSADQIPACLNTEELSYNTDVIAAGYGSTSFGGAFAKKLLKVFLKVIYNEICELEYNNQKILSSQLCVLGKIRHFNETESAIQDTCQGDSGGPLILFETVEFKPTVVGIVSYGRGCGSQAPGIYTNISSYIDWIESIIWANNNTEDKVFLN